MIDAFNNGSMVKITPSERKVEGYCRNNHGGVPENFHNYFVAVFDKDFESADTWKGDTLNRGVPEANGDHTGAIIRIQNQKGRKDTCKGGIIFHKPCSGSIKSETGDWG